jgi:hypothetical protein
MYTNPREETREVRQLLAPPDAAREAVDPDVGKGLRQALDGKADYRLPRLSIGCSLTPRKS